MENLGIHCRFLTTSNNPQGATPYGELCGDFSCTRKVTVYLLKSKKDFRSKILSIEKPIFFVQNSSLPQQKIKRDRSDMDSMENSACGK